MDNISFKSNIRFVPVNEFVKSNRHGVEIGFKLGETNVAKAPEFFTGNIRTCTAGGLVNSKEALGFHYLDSSFHNFFNINNFIKYLSMEIQPERGLLVGSKREAIHGYIFSIRNFRKFKQGLQKLTKNLSIFECHKHTYSQTHLSYSIKDDTWTLSHHFIDKDGKEDYIKNLTDLRKCYKKIKIAEGDRLFIGELEIDRTKV